MPILLFHEANLSSVKKGLRSALPHVRSSHLTEALATGLGFRTHAALLSRLGQYTNLPIEIMDVDEQAFAQRISNFGYPTPVSNILSTLVRSDVIPDRPYAEYAAGDNVANHAHFHACQRRSRPMMMILMARRYATLEWDCITIDSKHDGDRLAEDNGAGLMRALFRQFQARAKGAPGKPEFYGSAFTGRVMRLLPETARDLAEDYFRMLYPQSCENLQTAAMG